MVQRRGEEVMMVLRKEARAYGRGTIEPLPNNPKYL